MKIRNTGKTKDETNYKLFNVVMEETPKGIKVRLAEGLKKDKWNKLNSRYFARALKTKSLVTK